MECSSCGSRNPESASFCVGCGTDLNASPHELPEVEGCTSVASRPTASFPGEQALWVVKFVAWADLFGGIVIALVIWSNNAFNLSSGMFSGFAWLLQGVIVSAFLLVVASIAENLIAIRKELEADL